MSDGPGLNRVWAGVSLGLFLAMVAVHLGALSGLYAVPWVALLPVFFLVMVGQLLVIRAFPHGRDIGDQLAWSAWCRRNAFAVMAEGMKVIPGGWLVLALPLWFLYLPGMFFGQLAAHRDRAAEDRLAAVLFPLFLGMFSLLHFIMLRYVIPKKDEILERVEDRTRSSRRRGAGRYRRNSDRGSSGGR